MAVHDAPTHDKVKIQADKPYGCHSRKLLPTLANLGPAHGVRQFPMSRKCRSDGFLTDPRCAGCTTPKDVEYLISYGLIDKDAAAAA